MARDEIEGRRSPPSKILLDELFASEDDQFLDCFVQFDNYEYLKHFSIKWMEDSRPWARSQVIEYLQSTLNHPGHEVVFKRTLKWALEKADDELLVHFMVALDGLVRRSRTTSHVYDYRSRQSYRREYLFAKPNRTVREQTGRFQEYIHRKQTHRVPLPDIRNRPKNKLFSHKTRAHLRRRVWRYFRFMAHQDPARYVDAMTDAFAVYDNSFFRSGEAILDNWSLMHAGFYHAPEIAFTQSHTNLVAEQSLSTLKASPYLPLAWLGDRVAEKLWTLLANANSQFVRLWTIGMLQQQHAEWLSHVSIETLVQLLSSSDATVGEFAVDLFRNHSSLAHVEMTTWLRLLDEADFAVLPTICEAMQQHIDPKRLSDGQLLQMTMARPASVASLGLDWLKKRHQQKPVDADRLVALSACQCVWESELIADWAISELANPDCYPVDSQSIDRLIQFFDSSLKPIRRSACKWLESGGPDVTNANITFQHDPVLWASLSETPYDEVRFSLVNVLGLILDHPSAGSSKRSKRDQMTIEQWMRVYSAVVLCVDRGSRSKPKAVQQLVRLAEKDTAKEESGRAEKVIPVLAIAARSIRDSERFASLAGIATLLERRPELLETVTRFMPEWDWGACEESPLASGETSSTGGTA